MADRMKKEQSRPGRGHGPFGGGPPAMGPGEKPKNFRGTMRQLASYLRPYGFQIFIVIAFAIGSAAFSIVGPKYLGHATTRLFEGIVDKVSGVPGASIDFEYIRNIMLFLLTLYLLSTLFAFIQGYIMSGVSQRVSFNLRKEINEKMNRLPLRYFDTHSQGDVLSRVTNDVDTISNTLNQSLSQMITSITLMVGILVMMFSISWQMTIVALLILPVSGLFIAVIVKNSQKYFTQQQQSLGDINGHVEEMYGGHTIVKAFNGEERSIHKFDEMNDDLYHSAWKSQFLSGLMMPIMMFIGNLGFVGVSILGGFLAIKRVIEVGDILAFIQYVRNFIQPVTQTSQIANILQSTAAASERVFEFLNEAEEIPEKNGHIDVSSVSGHVGFNHVNFGYTEEKTIINDFSVDIKAGQRVAIVGPTGAGKSTIIKLLMRFYDIQGGDITVDGQSIYDIPREKLRDLFGMVLQDTWLYNGSIMENIRYGRLDATDEEVIDAARAAHADHFIRTLPDGYNLELNEEASNVSQGQKQLLTIARAILSDPKVLILDEATSSVDTRTEILIQRAMENLMKGRTSFIIAHRLSTIRDADVILVMKDGDIVEKGNHESLLAEGGFYADLYNSQFETEESA
ncbi:MAG: ABC transporter ATP-binding protein [Bacilli bacterium]